MFRFRSTSQPPHPTTQLSGAGLSFYLQYQSTQYSQDYGMLREESVSSCSPTQIHFVAALHLQGTGRFKILDSSSSSLYLLYHNRIVSGDFDGIVHFWEIGYSSENK